MKIWKVLDGLHVVAYVKVMETCNVYDTSYEALQLVRKKLCNDGISGTQLLDIDKGEQMKKGIPIFVLE